MSEGSWKAEMGTTVVHLLTLFLKKAAFEEVYLLLPAFSADSECRALQESLDLWSRTMPALPCIFNPVGITNDLHQGTEQGCGCWQTKTSVKPKLRSSPSAYIRQLPCVPPILCGFNPETALRLLPLFPLSLLPFAAGSASQNVDCFFSKGFSLSYKIPPLFFSFSFFWEMA